MTCGAMRHTAAPAGATSRALACVNTPVVSVTFRPRVVDRSVPVASYQSMPMLTERPAVAAWNHADAVTVDPGVTGIPLARIDAAVHITAFMFPLAVEVTARDDRPVLAWAVVRATEQLFPARQVPMPPSNPAAGPVRKFAAPKMVEKSSRTTGTAGVGWPGSGEATRISVGVSERP